MEAGFIVIMAVLFMVGIVSGIFIGLMIERSRTSKNVSKGFIYVSDNSAQPELFLQCTVPIEDIASNKQVLFDVTVL